MHTRLFLSDESCAPVHDVITQFMVRRWGLEAPMPEGWEMTEAASGSDGLGYRAQK